MKIAAVVVTYNRREQILKTINTLLAEAIDLVFVVDNGSTDGTRQDLSDVKDDRLILHFSDTNLGGAGGFELALRTVVRDHDPDWIVIMDDDGRPMSGAIERFRSSDTQAWDAVAGAVFYPSGQICEMNRPVLNPFKHTSIFFKTMFGGGRAAFHIPDDAFESSAPVPIDGSSFVGLFLSRRGVELAGYPDGRLFVYGEDGLYTLSLSQAGGRIAFFPDIHFEHDCSTFASAPGRFTPPWKAYYYHRNLLLLYRRAAGLFFWPALLIVLPKWFWKTKAQGETKGAYLRYLSRAIRDGLVGRFDRAHPD